MAYRHTSGVPGSTKRMAMSGLMEENPRPAKDVADEMLKTIGQKVLNLFKAGGKSFQDFDDAYAEKVRNVVMPDNPDGSLGSVARSMGGLFMGSPVTHGPAPVRYEDGGYGSPRNVVEAIGAYGIPAIGATARYVVPGSVITAGAAGIADLTQNLYDSASDIPVLPM